MPRASDEADQRAADYLATAPRCDVCGGQVATRGRTRHHSCDPATLAGKVCTCPAGCSDTHWGNGPKPCDTDCRPCRIMAGKRLPTKKDP